MRRELEQAGNTPRRGTRATSTRCCSTRASSVGFGPRSLWAVPTLRTTVRPPLGTPRPRMGCRDRGRGRETSPNTEAGEARAIAAHCVIRRIIRRESP